MQDLTLTLGDEVVDFAPERAVHWRRQSTIVVADLHWGKSEALQRAGLPLPSTPLIDDLARLESVARRFAARRILVLGDLIHARVGITPTVERTIADWRRRSPDLALDWIRGNHDQRLVVPTSWHMTEVADGLVADGLRFAHVPPDALADGVWTLAGHVHPSVILRRGADRARLPCFVVREGVVVLPAFGSLTGGFDLEPDARQRVYPIAGERVFSLQHI